MLWNRQSEVNHGIHWMHHTTAQGQRGRLAAEELPGLPSHQMLQLAGPASDLMSTWILWDTAKDRQQGVGPGAKASRAALVMQYRLANTLTLSLLCFSFYPFHSNWKELPKWNSQPAIRASIITSCCYWVSTLLILFWQPLLMTSLKGNPLENCLFHSLLPLSAFSASNIN